MSAVYLCLLCFLSSTLFCVLANLWSNVIIIYMTEQFDVIEFLKNAVSIGASDIHLNVGEHPSVRRDGKIIKISMPILTEDDINETCKILLPQYLKDEFGHILDMDFAFEIENCARFRVNLSRQLAKYSVVIRVIPYKIKNLQELNLPESIIQFANLDNGLVLVTGPTGSGKSTTMAALLDYINSSYQKHIVTIEDPVEFIFSNKKSIISQRQIVIDTLSFNDGIKYALRQDPDVIFIGEIRDNETISNALKAAETGHLVFATIHTNNAIHTVNRIIDMFPPADRLFVRNQLAEVLRGTVSQKLLPVTSGFGRRAACEVLVVTPTIKDFIIKDELEQIYDLVKKGSFNNMITLNMSLFKLVKDKIITQETALQASENKSELQQMFKGVYHGTGMDKK